MLTNKREEHIHSNTGRLLRLMLENNSLIYIGEKGWEKKIEDEIARSEYTPVIFYPISPFSDGQGIVRREGQTTEYYCSGYKLE